VATGSKRVLDVLRPDPGWRRHPVPWMLLVSPALNAVGVTNPFVEFRRKSSTID
jgi:hypothetical protein